MGLITVCVGVVINKGKVLIIKRGNPEGKLVYQFPAGKKETWEDERQGTVREVLEETGYSVKVIKTLGDRIHPYSKTHLSYRGCELKNTTPQKVTTKDTIAEVLRVPLEDVASYFTTDLFDPVKLWFGEYIA